eukprot:980056_1
MSSFWKTWFKVDHCLANIEVISFPIFVYGVAGLIRLQHVLVQGFGYFRDTQHGNALYQHCNTIMSSSQYKIGSFKDRLLSLLKQSIYLIWTKNNFYLAPVMVMIWYFTHNSVKLYHLSLAFRKNKTVSAFQHQINLFMKKPSIYQLYSIQFGLSKNYDAICDDDVRKRNLLLNNIPKQYHEALFPWITDETKEKYRMNKGIATYSWVYTQHIGDLDQFNDYLCDSGIWHLINTTWVHESKSKDNTAKDICQKMVHTPNLAEMDDRQIVYLSNVLTQYCNQKLISAI